MYHKLDKTKQITAKDIQLLHRLWCSKKSQRVITMIVVPIIESLVYAKNQVGRCVHWRNVWICPGEVSGQRKLFRL